MESGNCTDTRTRFFKVVKENYWPSQTTPHSQPKRPCSTLKPPMQIPYTSSHSRLSYVLLSATDNRVTPPKQLEVGQL